LVLLLYKGEFMPGSSSVPCCPDALPDTIRITLGPPICGSSGSGFPMIGAFDELGLSSSIGENTEEQKDFVEPQSSSGSELNDLTEDEIK
jgi:hypothetical protein